MSGINIDNSRRNYPYLCHYYKKIKKNDSTLSHEKKPDGYFYAKEIRNVEEDSQDITGTWQNEYKVCAIETPDELDIHKNDIVNFEGDDWLVIKVMEVEKTKRMYFSTKLPKYKQLILRR